MLAGLVADHGAVRVRDGAPAAIFIGLVAGCWSSSRRCSSRGPPRSTTRRRLVGARDVRGVGRDLAGALRRRPLRRRLEWRSGSRARPPLGKRRPARRRVHRRALVHRVGWRSTFVTFKVLPTSRSPGAPRTSASGSTFLRWASRLRNGGRRMSSGAKSRREHNQESGAAAVTRNRPLLSRPAR